VRRQEEKMSKEQVTITRKTYDELYGVFEKANRFCTIWRGNYGDAIQRVRATDMAGTELVAAVDKYWQDILPEFAPAEKTVIKLGEAVKHTTLGVCVFLGRATESYPSADCKVFAFSTGKEHIVIWHELSKIGE